MKFIYRLRTPRIDVDAYQRQLDKHMREAVAQAVQVWLDAVLMEIPTWSGASRATFIRLGQEISMGIPIALSGGVDRTGAGLAQSTGKVECAKGQYVFTYGTTLPWLIWNEYHNANADPDPTLFSRVLKEGPYAFQAKGAAVFARFAATVALPRVAPFVKSLPVQR